MHMISIPPMICFFVPVDFHVNRVTQDNTGITYVMSLIYSKLARIALSSEWQKKFRIVPQINWNKDNLTVY